MAKKISDAEKAAIAARIKAVIRDAGGLEAFSALVGGMSTGLLSQYQTAKTEPGLSAVMRIASAAGVTLDWLAMGLEPKFRRDVQSSARHFHAPVGQYAERDIHNHGKLR